jgi:fibronectin type 3 domain-containing protein
MKRTVSKILLLIATSLIAAGLNGCGGSGTTYIPVPSQSQNPGGDPSAKASLWANVTVRALDGTVNLQWDNIANPTGSSLYNIYSYTDTTPRRLISGKYNGRSFDHTALTNGTRYYYVVTEVTATGEGPDSAVVSAVPQAAPPIAPYGLKVTPLDSRVTLEFNGPIPPSSSSVRYNIYRSTTKSGFTSSNIVATKIPSFSTSSTSTPYVDLNLRNGTTYYYAVTAVTGVLESGFSPVVAAQPTANVAALPYKAETVIDPAQLAMYASPTGTVAVSQNGAAFVSWDVSTATLGAANNAVDPADYTKAPAYTLYWSDSPSINQSAFIGKIINVTKDASSGGFKLTGLTNGTTYYIRLAAVPVSKTDGSLLEDRQTFGPAVAVTPALKAPLAPGYLAATQYGADQVQLACKKDSSGTNGITYSIYMSTTPPASAADLVANGTRIYNGANVFFTHSGLSGGVTYYYTVTAVYEAESAPGPVVSVSL